MPVSSVLYTDEFGRDVEDVTDCYECIRAERCEANILVLYADGEDYVLDYLWLAHPTADLCRVMGSEASHWEKADVDPEKALFEQFNLF